MLGGENDWNERNAILSVQGPPKAWHYTFNLHNIFKRGSEKCLTLGHGCTEEGDQMGKTLEVHHKKKIVKENEKKIFLRGEAFKNTIIFFNIKALVSWERR